jgi:hypothetical protein
MRTILGALVLTAGVLPVGGYGADAFYLGNWKIVSAVVAPWADPARKPVVAEMKSLVGKTVSIGAKSIVGPRPVACNGPHYRVRDYPADMLFQGAFEEMHFRDKSVDPKKVAAKLGFEGSTFKTLETGCGNELDYHFANPTTALFGLNDYAYTLKKE